MRILVADDHELFLKGLEFILSSDELTLAKNYPEIIDILKQDSDFDLILTDLAMPGMPWAHGLKKIHELAPNTPIIILSAVFDKKIIDKTLELGVSGYIHKSSSNQEITNAIGLVMEGGFYIPQNLSMENQFEIDLGSDDSNLSPRQQEVINLMAKGQANKQIAYELGITEGTVKIYITEIFKKLGVVNRTQAILEAQKRGLVHNV